MRVLSPSVSESFSTSGLTYVRLRSSGTFFFRVLPDIGPGSDTCGAATVAVVSRSTAGLTERVFAA
jgi:hypothetical protein